MRGIPCLAVAVLCLFLSGRAADAQIVISEVLADPHSESKGEFVELYNAGDEPVDLDGWSLGDSRDVNDTITDFSGPYDVGLAGTVLAPAAYALVVDPDYEGTYGDRAVAGGDPGRLLMLTIKEDRTLGNGLGNSKDLVFIRKEGFTADQFEWTGSAGGNGVSWGARAVRHACGRYQHFTVHRSGRVNSGVQEQHGKRSPRGTGAGAARGACGTGRAGATRRACRPY